MILYVTKDCNDINPPLPPSSGGAWEALIKSAKKILQFLLRDRILDEESLHTFMVEVEWILNNRPFTPVSDSPEGLAALTPMALLSGCITTPLPSDVFIKWNSAKSNGSHDSWPLLT